ncbi:MAG: replicative DNA helicase [Eubacterium sp.]|nr:replicative DNA helicase [Eubacterium sp.]
MGEKIPPHNKEAEQSTLGAAMLNKDALFDVLEAVKADDFYDAAHKEIYNVIFDLARTNTSVDIVTVCDELKKRGSLEIAGGRAYVASLPSIVPSAMNAVGYAKIVAEKAQLRRLIIAADDIREKSFEESQDAEYILDHAEQSIFEIAQKRQKNDYAHIKDVMIENLEMIDRAIKAEGNITGVPTGFKELDKITGGLQRSDLIILAARPAMGKSSFALNVALNAAKRGSKGIIIFNLEMSSDQLGQRLLSMESNIELSNIRKGKIERNDWQKINIATDILSKTNITIDDTPGISMMEMKNKCRRMKAEYGLDLVVIDYLQLMNAEGKSESRQQEISKLSRYLKLLAREMDCPVLVLSQLSRAPELRSDHRPMLSDLRESGSIEQDADMVIFLYRDDYYNEENSEKPNVCEVHIAKHRNGETATRDLTWVKKYTKFSDMV